MLPDELHISTQEGDQVLINNLFVNEGTILSEVAWGKSWNLDLGLFHQLELAVLDDLLHILLSQFAALPSS